MTPVQPTLIEQFKNLRQKAVPIIAIEAADQMVAAMAIMAKYPDGKVPKIGWDSAKGFKGFNQAGGTADTLDPEDACDPAKAFKQLGTFPPGSMVFIFNAHLYLREMYPGRETVIQAIANVRDAYKTSAPARTLVLMAPSIVLPPELANDVLVLEEPAIRKEEVRRIVRDQHANAKKRAAEQGVTFGDLDDTTLELATSATLGCGSAFLVEQIVSVALDPESKTGLNLPNLWLRKNKVINDTRGLATASDGTTFKDITGMAALKEYFAMTFAGKEPPEAMAFIDEGEKAFHGFGTETSGSTTKQLGQFLKFMQDHRVLGFTLIGFAGCGKTQIIKACEGEFGRPVIAVKPEELEDSLVGGTALWTGLAQRTLDSISNGRLIMGITVNSMGTLPPEFKRRFSDTFFIDLPGPDALAECWKLYMRKWELTGPIPPHEGWTPDQVMKCCHRAFRFSCSLEQSAKFVVPFAVSNRKLIEELRGQADGIYLSADHPGAYHKPVEREQRSVSFKPEEDR